MSSVIINEKVRRRFESKFRVTPGCWIWTATIGPKGYGRFGLGGKNAIAPRVSHMLYIGEILPGLCVLHSCDNPICVNPDHLRQGTQKENAADMVSRGRHKGKGRLNRAQVEAIRADTRILTAIAADYGVTFQNIYAIQQGRSWKAPGAASPSGRRIAGRNYSRTAWSASDIAMLRTRYPSELAATIAGDLGRTAQQVFSKARALSLKKLGRVPRSLDSAATPILFGAQP